MCFKQNREDRIMQSKKLSISAITIILSALFLFKSDLYSTEKSTPKANDNLIKIFQQMQFKKDNFPAKKVVDTVTQYLLAEFDGYLKKPELYKKRVRKECSIFPEGTIYPYLIPAMAYAHLALKEPKMKPHALKQIEILINLAIPSVIERVCPPHDDLTELKTYRDHGTFLSTLNLALGVYFLIGGENKNYQKIFEHLSKIFYQAVFENKGKPINSYPEYSWNFDTMFVLVSLELYDRWKKISRMTPLIEKHLDWLEKHGTHKKTCLPYSIGWDTAPEGTCLPRGCDISMRLCLLAQLNPERAKKMYKNFVKSHWVDLGYAVGFSEWPKGMQRNLGDIDSGPIIWEIGLTATGVGLGTVQALKDKERLDRLCAELILVRQLMTLIKLNKNNKLLPPSFYEWDGNITNIDQRYFTGFLYGDAVLFYAITWEPFPKINKAENHK